MQTNPTTFYIIRHGETEWNVKQLMQGHQDTPLTLLGEEQARTLGETFKNIHFDQVFSSDLLRAKRTAEIMTLERKLAVNTTQLLRERTFGKYEGRRREEFEAENKALFAQYQKLSKEGQWKFKYADDMESNDEVATRLLTFIRETAVTFAGKNILVVSHGGVLRVLLEHLGQPAATGRGTIDNGAYIKFLCDGLEFEILEISGIARP